MGAAREEGKRQHSAVKVRTTFCTIGVMNGVEMKEGNAIVNVENRRRKRKKEMAQTVKEENEGRLNSLAVYELITEHNKERKQEVRKYHGPPPSSPILFRLLSEWKGRSNWALGGERQRKGRRRDKKDKYGKGVDTHHRTCNVRSGHGGGIG